MARLPRSARAPQSAPPPDAPDRDNLLAFWRNIVNTGQMKVGSRTVDCSPTDIMKASENLAKFTMSAPKTAPAGRHNGTAVPETPALLNLAEVLMQKITDQDLLRLASGDVPGAPPNPEDPDDEDPDA